MLHVKKIFGLITLFIGLTFALFSISTGQELTNINIGKATLSGTVVDASTPNPVSGATVKISLANKKSQTGEEGKFSFSGLNTGTYEVEVDHSDYKSYSKSVDLNKPNKQLMIKLEKK